MRTDLVIDAFEQVLHDRELDGRLIVHTDRGSQGVAVRYTNRLAVAELRGRGVCDAGMGRLVQHAAHSGTFGVCFPCPAEASMVRVPCSSWCRVLLDFISPLVERGMDLDLEQLAAAVLRLPDAARADLATRLLASLEPDVPGDSAAAIASAWDAELDRREAELAEDPSMGIPAAEVFRVLEADLAAQRAARSESVR